MHHPVNNKHDKQNNISDNYKIYWNNIANRSNIYHYSWIHIKNWC